MNQTLKNRLGFGPLHDKSVRKSGVPPPRLFRLRNGIHLPSGGAVLVRRGNRAAADAGGGRGLPVPGLSAEDGGECRPCLISRAVFPRHGRARPGHLRLSIDEVSKTWMPGTSSPKR